MTRLGDNRALDFVLLVRDRPGKYHRPVTTTFGYMAACGTTGLMHQMDESVAAVRYKRARCGRCWRPS